MSKFNLAYDNGIDLMKEINADIKTIGEISKWPLVSLIAIVAGLASIIVNDSQTVFYQFGFLAIGVLIVCSIMIMFILLTITIPSLAIHAHNQPKNLMTGSADSIMKKEIERLQSGIDINMSRLKSLKKRLIGSIISSFFFLAYSFTWFLIQV